MDSVIMKDSIDNKHILLACTGSVATIKLPLLIERLFQKAQDINIHIEISVIVTEYAKHFFDQSEIPKTVKIYTDDHEWKFWNKRGDPVLHIDLTKWADVMCIAPLDANTLAKISNGLCDNLLTCTVRAWNTSKPLLFCPAMNTRMWDHPITAPQVKTLKDWGYIEVPCISKTLVCGDTGNGAMADVNTIVDVVIDELNKKL
ncbi:phosphopantothenoylcysteine decarboxylase-like [Ctenocephalides felis]|uniref:phosphopantothenoylcysteine decarboxylase-like n=1 Tax=Ctenocephalides felis TaxID=7515 RepID=UPI000E6E5BD6|nr:phosphopantothenoylcysteine decarboxylase-like [Ctenocephalides felis]